MNENETLPIALTEFGDQLERAIARQAVTPEPTPPRRRRRPPRRHTLVGVAAGLAVAGAVGAGVALVTEGGGSAGSVWDAHVLRAAEIALPKPAPNTIVHVSVTQTMTPGARGRSALLVPTVDAEGWFEQGPPWRSVTREQVPGQTPTWQTGSRIYDPATKRVYVDPPFPSSHPRFTLTRTGDNGVITLRIATAYGPVRQTVTTAEARGLRSGADQIGWVGFLDRGRFALQATITPRSQSSKAGQAEQPISTSLSFPAQLHRLLQSGHARVLGRVSVDGRAAIKIAISGVSGYQRMVYYVDPSTYRPIELDYYGSSDADLTRIVFHVYRQLPVRDNADLLRLHTPSGTQLDPSPAGFFRHIPALLFW